METAAIYVGFKSTPSYTTISQAHGFKLQLLKVCQLNFVAKVL